MGNSLNGQPLVRMEFINKNINIRIGDEVTTSGFTQDDHFFPAGVHIGYVEKVYKDESGLFQHAEIIPRATSGLLDFLFIASKKDKELWKYTLKYLASIISFVFKIIYYIDQ